MKIDNNCIKKDDSVDLCEFAKLRDRFFTAKIVLQNYAEFKNYPIYIFIGTPCILHRDIL